MEGGPPTFRQGFTCPALLKDHLSHYAYGALTHCGRPFQILRLPLRQPLAHSAFARHYSRNLMLMSVPPGTEMFQFPGFASPPYGFRQGSLLREGFPHSDIRGSKVARTSPRLIAACHVLLRLLAPRHPPNALVITHITSTARAQDQAAQPRKATRPNPHISRLRHHQSQLIHASSKTRPKPRQGTRPSHSTPSPARSHPIHRLKEHATHPRAQRPQGRRQSAEGSRRPTRASQAPRPRKLEASGFEPLTPCLQSRCSTS